MATSGSLPPPLSPLSPLPPSSLMRRIGFVEGSTEAERFCDYLISQQIQAIAEPEDDAPQRHAIWVKDEARVEEAREALELYRANPQEPRFEASKQAKAIRAQQAAENRRRLQNLRRMPQSTPGTLSNQRVPVTIAAIAICVVVGLLTGFGNPSVRVDRAGREYPTIESRTYDALTFVNRHDLPRGVHPREDAFVSVRQGEVWRIVTPAILHGSIGHLAMNMMGLFFLGSVIERLHGGRWLALMLFGTALIASLVQVFWPAMNNGGPLAVGASGVTYGLFGFLLLRPRFDPFYPVRLPPMFQALGLGFLILGVMMVVPGIANGAHVGGLAAGMLFAALVPSGSRSRD